RARLPRAARDDALARPPDRQRIAPANGAGVDGSMRAGWCASPGPRREPDRIREERFLLHDMFAVPFEEVGPIVGRPAEPLLVVLDRLTPADPLAFVRGSSPEQLASRARRRVRGATAPDPDLSRQREVVDAFLAALRGGDFAGLLAI